MRKLLAEMFKEARKVSEIIYIETWTILKLKMRVWALQSWRKLNTQEHTDWRAGCPG